MRPSVITLQSLCWYVSQSIRLGNQTIMFDSDYSFFSFVMHCGNLKASLCRQLRHMYHLVLTTELLSPFYVRVLS